MMNLYKEDFIVNSVLGSLWLYVWWEKFGYFKFHMYGMSNKVYQSNLSGYAISLSVTVPAQEGYAIQKRM